MSETPQSTLFLFEDEEGRRVFEALVPDAGTATFDDLAAAAGTPLPSRAERLAIFREGLPESSLAHAEAELATIERLRAGNVLTATDVAFAFSELPATPKNHSLRAGFLRYLELGLADDRASRAAELVERLSEGAVTFHAAAHVRFVPSRTNPTAAFADAARAFVHAKGVESVELVEMWRLFAFEKGRRPLWLHAEPAIALRGLGQALRRELERGTPPGSIAVALATKTAETELLRHYLDHLRIPVHDVRGNSARTVTRNEVERLLAAVRSEPGRGRAERLGLASVLTTQLTYRRATEPLDAWLARLEARGLLGTRKAAELLALAPSDGDSFGPAGTASGVRLLPPIAPPAIAGLKVLAFFDETFFHPPEDGCVLTEAELETLQSRGFPVAGAAHFRARADACLSAFARAFVTRPLLFHSLAPEVVPESARQRRLHRTALTPPRPSVATAPRPEPTRVAASADALSATALEAYASCPARYFFSYRLRLRATDGDTDRQALLFGQAVHLALETAFARRDLPADNDGMVSAIEAAFETAMDSLAPDLHAEHPTRVLLREAFAPMARGVPALEAHLDDLFGPREKVRFELPFGIQLGPVRVKGKIDRVDKLADGTLLLIDYKTGNVDFTPDHVARGENFQALVYAVAAEQVLGAPCAGLIFYDLKKGEAKRGLLREDRVPKGAKAGLVRGHVVAPEKFDRIRELGLEQVDALARRLANGEFEPSPSAAACEYCDYTNLCRARHGYG